MPTSTLDAASVTAALTRYRIIAYVVGVLLVVLVCVGVPLRYLAGQPGVVAVVGPLHGFLYMAYLALTADLARRVGWRLGRMLVVMLAGTVPFLSFAAERSVTHEVRDRMLRPSPTGPDGG